ncbi:MAG TPA: CoA transferase, partial [Pseudomonadales bacterium]|nr:CoA transferase [Pseudomonadales bacterium]
KCVVIGGNGDSIFRRLMETIGREDLGNDPQLASNAGRVEREPEIDAALAAWCAVRPAAEVLDLLQQRRVPAGPIYDVADLSADPHFRARGLFERVEVDGRLLEIPALMPRLRDTPGATEWPGPAIGSHTDEVLREVLDLDEQAIAALRADGVI